MENLPQHLQKYIVDQDYRKYTPRDHASWRFILRQLKKFLSTNAHSSYLDGLTKTGIEIEQIPKITDISKNLEKFGWRALPVSGFIPPAAFMELQSLGVLPIASDMRSIDHLLYTPAPDIVHEAAGHAPFIADEEYADYLKQYAQVAKKAIISKEDLDVYEAIRNLSDIKENPKSNSQEIAAAEAKLSEVSNKVSFTSEASELSRMNWWTAEYGLVGDLQQPKIFGAGLLSSVGESKWCLSEKVIKIPLTVDCIKQNYDITEPQPQLYVAKDFQHLKIVLNELAETMAFKTGGLSGLKKALQAQTVNTIEFESGLQISGTLNKFILGENSQVHYLQFSGPTQLCHNGKQIEGHSKEYHAHGYGTPIGILKNTDSLNVNAEKTLNLEFESGIKITGCLIKIIKFSNEGMLLSFDKATCKYKDQVLFLPEWGVYDIIVAKEIKSVFSGPADRPAYGDLEDFVASRVSQPVYTEEQLNLFSHYENIRKMRLNKTNTELAIKNQFELILKSYPNEWLLYLELLELAILANSANDSILKIDAHLKNIASANKNLFSQITSGIQLAYEKY